MICSNKKPAKLKPHNFPGNLCYVFNGIQIKSPKQGLETGYCVPKQKMK